MNPETYEDLVRRLTKPLGDKMDLLHSALGVTSEAGEIADAIKAAAVYGRPLDIINLVEELGDLRFFATMAAQKLGLTADDIERANMAKLNARYAEGYSDASANNRKKEFEREAIEKAVWGNTGIPYMFLDLT